MTAEELARTLRYDSKMHHKILSAVNNRWTLSDKHFARRYEAWRKDEKQYLAYIPETDADALRRQKRELEGIPQQTTLIIPYTYAILMTAHTYWTSVFLSRDPIFQFQGRHGEAEMNIQMLEAIINYQVLVGEHVIPYYIWLLDMGKYGVGILGVHWDEEVRRTSELVEVPATFLGMPIGTKTKKVYETRETKAFEGNKVYNVRPYNFFPDPRVPLMKFQEGEFTIVDIEGTSALDVLAETDYFNLDQLGRWPGTATQDSEGAEQIDRPAPEEEVQPPNDVTQTRTVHLREAYVRLVPRVWGLGDSDRQEKWVFTIANKRLVIGARPMGNDHDRFPFVIQEYEPDGYALYTRSLMEISRPMQEIIDWLVNTHFFNIRKVLNDSMIVDPSLVVMKDILDPNPGKIIRLKPRGWGAGIIDKAIQQLQVQDVTGTHIGDVSLIAQMIQRTHGVTEQVMGQPLPSGRRSATESRQTAGFGINRLKTNAEFASAQGWSPLSMMMVQNTQQYMSIDQQFRIAGDTINKRGLQQYVDATREEIQGFYDFIPVDGTMPVDRLAQATLWQQLFGSMAQMPAIMAEYDVGGLFAWVAKLAGNKAIDRFRLELTDEDKLRIQLQEGNVTPLSEVENDVGGGVESGGGDAEAAGTTGPGLQSGLGRVA